MRLSWFLLTITLIFSNTVQSQENTPLPRLLVAVFTQLYLDSSFTDDGVYKHDMLMPKYMLPGLDFTEGLLIGADSLKNANDIEIRIYVPAPCVLYGKTEIDCGCSSRKNICGFAVRCRNELVRASAMLSIGANGDYHEKTEDNQRSPICEGDVEDRRLVRGIKRGEYIRSAKACL